MVTAKVFRSGNSQAIRIPKEYRFPPGVQELSIRRAGDAIVLEPITPSTWPESFWDAFGGMPKGFARPPQVPQDREELEV